MINLSKSGYRIGRYDSCKLYESDLIEYATNHQRRGKAIIFNHSRFKNEYWAKREENERDEYSLQEELKWLGFEVILLRDYTLIKVKEALRQIQMEDHTSADCLVVVVITNEKQLPKHDLYNCTGSIGYNLRKIAAYDDYYELKELFEPFEDPKCPSLTGKPKIFFIQTYNVEDECETPRSKYMVAKSDKSYSRKPDSNFIMFPMPNSPDFLVFIATVDDSNFIQGESKGNSNFIQIFCEELKNNRSRREELLDLESLLIEVKRKLLMPNVQSYREKNSVPYVYSTLIRKLYLKPKKIMY